MGNPATAATCDPNWSPKFSQVKMGGFDGSKASVQQITDQQIAKFGGVNQSISKVENELTSYQEQLVQHQNAGDADGVNQLQQLILFSKGMLEVLRCRQGMSPGQTTNSAAARPNIYTPGSNTQNSGTSTTTHTYTPGMSSDGCFQGDGRGTVACNENGQTPSSLEGGAVGSGGRNSKVYVPGSSTSDNLSTTTNSDGAPATAPSNDDSKGMLTREGI
jgi:hypothetical protein